MVVDGTSIVAEVKSSWAVMRKSDVTALGDIAKKIRPDVALLAVMDTGKKHREALEALGSELREAGIKLQVMTLDTNPLHDDPYLRSEEHTSELQSLMRNSYAVYSMKKKTIIHTTHKQRKKKN